MQVTLQRPPSHARNHQGPGVTLTANFTLGSQSDESLVHDPDSGFVLVTCLVGNTVTPPAMSCPVVSPPTHTLYRRSAATCTWL